MSSKIRQLGKERLEAIANREPSFSAILRATGLTPKGGNIHTLIRVLDDFGIDYSHIPRGKDANKGRKFSSPPNKIELSEILVEGSQYRNTARIRVRLIEAGMLENKCVKCGQGPTWNGEPLTMNLDHINGVRDDNRIENLRILCPNCHSQTPTFAGKSLKRFH